MADFVVGSAAVLIKPVFQNLQKDVRKNLSKVVPAEASKAGTQAGRAMGQATAKSLGATTPAITKAASAAGTAAGASFASRTAAAITSRSATVSRAVGAVTSAASRVSSVAGSVAGSGFVTSLRTAVAAGSGAVRTAAGVVSSAASRVVAAGGAIAGSRFVVGVRTAIASGAGTLRAAAASVGASMATTFRAAGATAGAGFSGGFMASLGPLAGMLTLFAPIAAIASGANRAMNLEDAAARLVGQGVSQQDTDRITGSAVASVQGTPFARDQAMTVAGGAYMSGVDLEGIEDHLTLVGDITAQSNLDYTRAGELMNRITGEGKVTGEVVQQLTENGLYALPILAEHFGVTQDAMRKMVTDGEVSAEDFRTAMVGVIGGSAQEMGNTTRGAFRNLASAAAGVGQTVWDAIAGTKRDENGVVIQEGTRVKDMLNGLKESLNDFNGTVKDGIERFQEFAKENKWLVPLLQGVATAFAGIALGIPIIHKIMGVFKVLGAVIVGHPILLVLAAIAGLFVYLWKTNDTFREGVINAFNKIKEVITDVWTNTIQPALQAFWSWIVETLVPALQNFWTNTVKPIFEQIGNIIQTVWTNLIWPALQSLWSWINDKLIPIITDLWENSVRPTFEQIGAIIEDAWTNKIQPALSQLWSFIQDTLMPTLLNLWQNVILPVFTAVAEIVSWAFKTIILPLFKIIVSFLFDVLFPAFLWLLNKVVLPVFNGLVDIIGGAVTGVLDIFRGLKTWVTETIPNAFRDGVDAIGRFWNRIQELAAVPVNFVIDTVYNDGIREVFNKIAGAIPGVDMQLPRANRVSWGRAQPPAAPPRVAPGQVRAFAKGGYAAPGWALVGEEGPELVNFSKPGRVYTAEESQAMFSASQTPHGNILQSAWSGLQRGLETVGGWVRGGLRKLAETIISPARNLLNEHVTGDGIFSQSIRGAGHHIMDKLVGWAGSEDEKGIDPGPMGDRIRGALDYVNRAGWAVFNHIGDPGMTMQTINQSMYGGHRTGKAIDFLGVSTSKLQQASEFMAANAEAMRIKYIAWNRQIWRPGSGWGPLSGGVGNDPGHTWHSHAEFYDNGGILPPGLTLTHNATGGPEYILNKPQWDSIATLASQAMGGFTDEVYLNVDGERFKAYVETRADSRIAAGKRRAARV